MNNIQLPDPYGAREYFVRKTRYSTGPVELQKAIDAGEDLNIVDVREAEDYQKGHVPGSVNLPKSRWSSRDGLREDIPNVLLCYSALCHLAATAGAEFATAGFPVLEMDGGFEAWKDHELPIEKGQMNRATAMHR